MITYGSITLTSYNTITKIEVYYYKSTSATDLAGGSWSTTKPTWENGKYIWQKIKTTYEGKLENGQFYSESDPVNITGQQGATGTAAYSYKLNASDSVIGKTKTGEYTIDKITFTATYKQGTGAVTAYTGRFKIETTANGTTWTTQYTSSGNESSKEYTIPEDIISIRCSLYQSGGTSTLLDITTIPVVKDGIDAVGLRDSIPYYLASDKQTGVTRLDQGWTRFKPELTTEKRYLWIYYVSRYSEGDTQPELIEIKNDIVSFENHGDESPVENCVIDIEPVQDLNGQDAPYPAGGGKNLFGGFVKGYNIVDSTGEETESNSSAASGYIDLPETFATASYYISGLTDRLYSVIYFYDASHNYIGRTGGAARTSFLLQTSTIVGSLTGIEPSTCKSVRVTQYQNPNVPGVIDEVDNLKTQIEKGSTATSYSPYSNICPISGFTEANVVRTGVNIWDEEWEVGWFDWTTGQEVVSYAYIRFKNLVSVKPATQYVFVKPSGIFARPVYYDADGVFVSCPDVIYTAYPYTVLTIPDNVYYVRFAIKETSYSNDVSLNYPSTDHDYHPYAGDTYPITFPSEAGIVYGGTLDVTKGELVVDRAIVDLGTLTWAKSESVWRTFYSTGIRDAVKKINGDINVNNFSSVYKTRTNDITSSGDNYIYTTTIGEIALKDTSKANLTGSAFKTAMNGVQFCYPLATPITYTLTPQEITMLTGQNHIFSDTGQTAISYYDNQTSTNPYIDYSATSAFEVAQSVSDAVGTLQTPYKEVEWVESTGKQYIYLDWKPPIKTWGFEIDFLSKNATGTSAGAWNETTNVNGYGNIFGVRSASGVNNVQLSSYNNGLLRVGNSTNIATGFKTDHTRQTIKLLNNTITKTDGTTATITRVDEDSSKNYCNMTIFALYNDALRRRSTCSINEPSSTRIYSLKFYDGDTLTVDLVGAIRKADKVTGLYDKVSKHFYPAPGMLYGNDVGDIIIDDTITENLNKTDVKATVINKNRSRMWEANVPFSKLEDGQKITVTYSYGGIVGSVETTELVGWDDTSSNYDVYLKLVFPNGDKTEWIPCYYSNTTRLTTHYNAGTPITFTYHENLLQNATETSGGAAVVKGFFATASYYSNTSYTQYSNNVKAGTNGIKAYTLIMQDGEDTWSCFYSGAMKFTNTGKPAYTGGFRLGKVLYSSGSGAQTSNSSLDTYYNYKEGVVTSTIYDAYPVDLRYSTNCATTLTAQRPVYLVGTVENDGLFHLDISQWWTQTIPTYEDGKVYIYLGITYSTYQLWLATENPAYVYYNNEFILYDKALTLQNIATLKDSLETQIDGKVETWCQKTNPALSWDATERPNHTGDLWYYTGESDNTYKNNTTYQYNGSTNTWTQYSANPDLFDKIDGKAAIYYGTTSSVTSAEKGDYLVDSTDGSSYRWDGSKWVKVTDYKTAIDDASTAIISRGEQLVINGNGMMGSNYNFSSLTFDGSKSNGSPGSFTRPAETISRTIYSDEFFPVTPSNTYVLSFDLMSLNNLSTMYAFINFYDVDKKQIDAEMHMYCPNTLTTLSQDLKNGDTVVHLTDTSNWETTGSYNHGFIFWNYVNSFGYQYPEHTYSRNKWDKLFDLSNIDKTNNTITLTEAWSHGTFPAGTKLSQKNAGATFKYLGITGNIVPNTWTSYKGRIGDIDYSGNNMMGMFPPGTAYAKVGFLWNYNKANDQVWVTNISVKEDVTRGTGFYAITTAPTAYTTQVGNFTPAYRIALSTVKTQSGLEEIMIGDVIQQGYNTYPVGYVDTSYVYLGSANSIRGATGATGLNNAQVILYRRFASAPSGTNVAPTGDVTYTFSTGKAANNLNSWTQNIPSGSDPVYMIAASASSTSSTDTIPKTEWSAPVKILENGQDGGTGSAGADGYNQATIFLYQRKSGTAPSKPSSAVTYTFSSGALNSTPTGWSRTIPTNNGNPCYVTTATAVAKTATYSIPANGWSDVVILSQDGEDGTSITITSTSVKYQKGTSGTTAPTGTWGTSIPTVGENEFLWTQTIVNYSDNSKTESYSVSRNAKNGTNGTSPTVSSTTVEYQQSTGGTTPPTGTWSTTAPTATAGQYMWTRTTVTYSDSKTAVSYSVSKNGTNGTSPTAYHLIVSHGAINKNQAGVYNPTTVTLTSKYQTGNGALNNYSGRFKIETTTDNNTWTQDSASSTANESSKTYTIPANIKAVRFSLYLAGGFTTLLDQQTVPVVTDGAKGDNGEDAYTIVLTNEAHTFPAGVSAALAGSATSNVMTYKGGVQVACFVGSTSSATSISTGTTGLTCAINNNNSKNVSLTFTATTSLTTRAGTVTIPITVDNKSFSKTFTWSLANQGAKGDNGVSVTNVTSTNNTADGGTSVVTITLSDGTTKTFNVKNGTKGNTGATAQWYYGTSLTHTSGTATLVATSTSGAVVGSMYLNTQTSLVYKCTAVGTNNTWTYAGDLTTGVIDNIEIGGRNLLLNTAKMTTWNKGLGEVTLTDEYALLQGTDADWGSRIDSRKLDLSLLDGETNYILSFEYKSSIDTISAPIMIAGTNHSKEDNIWDRTKYCAWSAPNVVLSNTNGEWKKFTTTSRTITLSNLSVGSGDVNSWYLQMYVRTNNANLYVRKFQLEKGNKSTDWTLAPEDIDSNIQQVQDNLDNLEIGGRNLFRNSKTLSRSWAVNQATITDGVATVAPTESGNRRIYQMPAAGCWTWTVGQEYTVSVDARSDNGASFTFVATGVASDGTAITSPAITATSEWKRYSFTFTAAHSSNGSMTFSIVEASSKTIQFKEPKLEYGGKATSWTPAPEDTQADIDTAQSTADEALAATQPLYTKTYTGLIGSANDYTNASFYFAKIHPTSYTTNYKVKMKVRVTAPEAYAETIDMQLGGYGSTFSSYDSYTTRTGSVGIYYINLYRATQAGISTNHKGHALGVGLRSSTNPTNTSYKRTIIVDILELENCTIEMLDTAVKYANIDGTGSTNYSGLTEMYVATAGQNATNNANTHYTQYANNVRAGINGIKGYTLIMQDSENTWSCFCVGAYNGTANSGKSINPDLGFIPGKVLYSAGAGAQTSNSSLDTYYNYKPGVATSTVYDSYNLDLRYSTMCGSTLVTYKPVYLVGIIKEDGLFYFEASNLWWTQTEPTEEDGKVYIFLGMANSTTTLFLNTENPAYVFYDGKFMEYKEAQAEKAKKTATNYMSSDNTGIMVADLKDGNFLPGDSNLQGKNVYITAGYENESGTITVDPGVYIRDGQTDLAMFGETVRIGQKNDNYVYIDNDSVDIMNGATSTPVTYASFGETSVIGEDCKISMAPDSFKMFNPKGYSMVDFSTDNSHDGYAYASIYTSGDGTRTSFYSYYSLDLIRDCFYEDNENEKIPFPSINPENKTNFIFASPPQSNRTFVLKYGTLDNLYNFTLGTRYSGDTPEHGAYGSRSISLGNSNNAFGAESIAIGTRNNINSNANMAIGYYLNVDTYKDGTPKDESKAQLVLGRYNEQKSCTDYSFIIGNGTSKTNRHNVFAITTSDEIQFSLNTSASSGTTDAELYDAITALGWQNDVIV